MGGLDRLAERHGDPGGGALSHPIHTLRRGVVHVARAEAVYPSLEPGSVALVISDGPYGMGKAAWDRQRGEDGLREWYRPHVEAWGRVCAPAASVYVWGTDDSASALRPLMREHGWTKRVRVTWDKGIAVQAGRGTGSFTTWSDVTEVCDMYQRGADFGRLIYEARSRAGLSRQALARAVVGTGSGCVWNWEDGQTPSDENFAHAMRACGDERHVFELMNWYSENRPHFVHPVGVGNVWSAPTVAGAERLCGADGETLHPCQKPLAFSDRIIRASSRPGDLVLEPFGGTLRAAVACERMPEREARRYVCVEPDEDGRGYVPAVLASIGYGEAVEVEQVPLW